MAASEALVAYLDDMYSVRGKWIEGDTPDDRMLLAAGELAKAVAFLVSSGAGYITGQNLRVDGGLTRSV